MAKPIYIYSINTNYTRCEVWHGSRSFHNKLGSSILVPDKGLTRQQRYGVIVQWLHERFDLITPCYREPKSKTKKRKAA